MAVRTQLDFCYLNEIENNTSSMHFNPIYSLIAAVVMIAIYRSTQHQIFHGMPWSKHDHDFWGSKSHVLKYKLNSGNLHQGTHLNQPRFPGSTTWLVFLTDWVHM